MPWYLCLATSALLMLFVLCVIGLISECRADRAAARRAATHRLETNADLQMQRVLQAGVQQMFDAVRRQP